MLEVIYNHFLSKCKENGYIKAYDMRKELKKLELDYPFLKEVDCMSLRCSIFNLEDSYKNYFFKRYPSFKIKCGKQRYRTSCITNSYKNKKYSNIKIDMKEKINNLNIRTWRCKYCGNTNDRDINAIINIMFEKIKMHYAN